MIQSQSGERENFQKTLPRKKENSFIIKNRMALTSFGSMGNISKNMQPEQSGGDQPTYKKSSSIQDESKVLAKNLWE